jgi:hypothetical protein
VSQQAAYTIRNIEELFLSICVWWTAIREVACSHISNDMWDTLTLASMCPDTYTKTRVGHIELKSYNYLFLQCFLYNLLPMCPVCVWGWTHRHIRDTLFYKIYIGKCGQAGYSSKRSSRSSDVAVKYAPTATYFSSIFLFFYSGLEVVSIVGSSRSSENRQKYF